MILFPNAKINLGLNIIHRRDDGYHNIVTVMYPTSWSDILEIVPSSSEETTLTVTGRAVDCPPEKNLVMKAYRALNVYTPLPPVDIFLHKIIPDGAGLGGGSADAAFTLRGLNELFALDIPDHTLAEIAAGIGADCPFFIYNRPMLCTGTGTDMTPYDIDLSAYRLAIIKPPCSVPTREAYAGVTPHQPAEELTSLLRHPVGHWKGRVVNDFEASVFPQYPVIGQIKERLYDLGAEYAAMSGSGSAVFALFNHDILAEDLSRHFENCTMFIG
ncbi:MAG: 4-(cytidine 5'-diphospho)-2-C-methyl-D-erythritol kinase [Lachnoclostridium sp.]|nr:4-(cytidine 5'-diphospho)-2-C-methyl-D-erythritol kinase [Lachnoclostridium sp.]